MTKRSRPSLSLRLKLTAVVVLVAVLPLAVVGYSVISIKTDALRHANRELLFAITQDVAHTAIATLNETEDQLSSVGSALTNQTRSLDERLELALELVSNTRALARVGIYDDQGAVIDVIGEGGSNAPTPPEALDAVDPAKRLLGRPTIIAAAPHVLMVVPVKGERTWYAATYVSLEALQTRVSQIASERFGDELSSLMVVDSYFRAIAHPNRELSDVLAPMHEHGLLRDFIGGRLPGGVSVFQIDARDIDGVSMAAVLVSIDELRWGVIAQLPTEKAFSSLTEMRNLIIALLLLVMFVAGGTAIFLAHRLTEPIRKLVGFAESLAQRKFDQRVTIHTRDELSVLGQALSTAASDLEESEREIKEQVEIRSNLGRYLPGQLVERIIKREQNLDLGGERREITVLFADVAGFTPLAESHAAEDVVTILNELFTILTEIVFRHEGTVDKFVGDCVMAFWGAPDPQVDHGARALRAAEDMLRFLELGNKSWEEKYGVRIRLAIGVNSGDAVVGNFGSETRMEYTAIGNVVNLAAHLEAIARPQQIVVSAATKKAAGDDFDYLELGERQLPGHKHPTELFEVRL